MEMRLALLCQKKKGKTFCEMNEKRRIFHVPKWFDLRLARVIHDPLNIKFPSNCTISPASPAS